MERKDLHKVFINLESVGTKSKGKFSRDDWRLEVYIRVIKDRWIGAKTQVRIVGEDLEHFTVLMGLHKDKPLAVFYLPWCWMD